jgi:hypothetical protein
VKLRIFTQILIGFILSWFSATVVGRDNAYIVLAAIPLIGFIHEVLHLVPLKLYRLDFNFVVNGMLIRFKSTFRNIDQYIVTATAPQILTIALAILYILTMNTYVLILSVLHIVISCEDILKVFRYIVNYST